MDNAPVVHKPRMHEPFYPYAFFQGNIVPTKEATINIMTNAFQYGNAVFGGIRGYIGRDKKTLSIFRLSNHYKRFLSSLRILNVSIPFDEQKLVAITLQLAQKNKPDIDCYFRPIAYAADYGLSPDLAKTTFDFALYMIELGEYLPLSRGLRLLISNWARIPDNVIPARAKITGGYVNSSLAKADATRLGFDDALVMTQDGHITEGSAANFFLVRDGVLITAPRYSDVLEGVTRRTIIELARDCAIPVEERPIDRTEVYVADEAFLTGTGAQVAWVAEVDGRVIGTGNIGAITKTIQELFFRIVRADEKRYAHWLTHV